MASFRTMKTLESDDKTWHMYRAACQCGNPKCDLSLELEYDREINDVTLTLYKDLYYCSYWFADCRDSFKWVTKILGKKRGVDVQDWLEDKYYIAKDIWYRLKGAVRLLFTGRIELEEAFLFENEEQIDAFLNALNEGKIQIHNKLHKEDSNA
jgi:hypothetical protein